MLAHHLTTAHLRRAAGLDHLRASRPTSEHLGDVDAAKYRWTERTRLGCSEIERESLGGIRRARGGERDRACRSPLLGDLSDDAPFESH